MKKCVLVFGHYENKYIKSKCDRQYHIQSHGYRYTSEWIHRLTNSAEYMNMNWKSFIYMNIQYTFINKCKRHRQKYYEFMYRMMRCLCIHILVYAWWWKDVYVWVKTKFLSVCVGGRRMGWLCRGNFCDNGLSRILMERASWKMEWVWQIESTSNFYRRLIRIEFIQMSSDLTLLIYCHAKVSVTWRGRSCILLKTMSPRSAEVLTSEHGFLRDGEIFLGKFVNVLKIC